MTARGLIIYLLRFLLGVYLAYFFSAAHSAKLNTICIIITGLLIGGLIFLGGLAPSDPKWVKSHLPLCLAWMVWVSAAYVPYGAFVNGDYFRFGLALMICGVAAAYAGRVTRAWIEIQW